MAPVHEAAREDDVEALRELLDAEPRLVEVEDEGFLGRSPLHCACYYGSVEAALLLLDRGAGIDSMDRGGSTPLMDACCGGHVEVVSLLLARGADPCRRGVVLFTPLIWACRGDGGPGSDPVAVLRLLLMDGRVPVDARDSVHGWTALHVACYYGHAERARVLLVEGRADHTIVSNEGETPMAVAQRHGHDECVRLIEGYEEGLEMAFLVSKARAVVEASECISRAAEKVGARTQAEAQAAREEAAPAYLCGRVCSGEALPVVEVLGQEEGGEEEEERRAVLEYVVMRLKDDLFVECMEGLPDWRGKDGEDGESDGIEEEEVEEEEEDDDDDEEGDDDSCGEEGDSDTDGEG